ncbi:MAG: hypothetical protein OXI83_18385 [Gemmatimonadota bacterium]|nr:hypothetical protein [Gemmatimonadota bacterium]
MLGFIDWYLNSLAQFWGTAIRIGLPQILLVILLICWIRRRRCRRAAAGSNGDSCCWAWTCGYDGDCWFRRPVECGSAGGRRCGKDAAAEDGEEEDGDS